LDGLYERGDDIIEPLHGINLYKNTPFNWIAVPISATFSDISCR